MLMHQTLCNRYFNLHHEIVHIEKIFNGTGLLI